MKGKIFKIQKFCTNDGPGIRTMVFLKGCPLTCIWCHNPESQTKKSEIMYIPEKCINCFCCVSLCPQGCHIFTGEKHFFERTNCTVCGKCINPQCNALEISGYEISADDILRELIKDKLFYDNSGGGITLSGGEPLYQEEFCLEILKKAKQNNLHTCIETCGFVPQEVIIKSAEFTDIYLFDFKETNPARHKEFTGVDNSVILQNLKIIDDMGKNIILRCPIIPGYNDNDEHFNGIAQLANSLKNIIQIEIEPYHNLGADKYSRLGRIYKLKNVKVPDDSVKNFWIKKISEKTKIKVL